MLAGAGQGLPVGLYVDRFIDCGEPNRACGTGLESGFANSLESYFPCGLESDFPCVIRKLRTPAEGVSGVCQ